MPGVSAQEQVTFAGDRSYPPFHFVDTNGQADGFDVALFRAVAAEAGLTPRFELGDWRHSLDALQAGRADVVPMFVTPERSRRFLFSRPILERYHLAFARSGGRYIGTLEDLRGERVAVQAGGLAWEALQEMEGVSLILTELESGAIDAVHAGVADYALVPTTIGYATLLDRGIDDVVALSRPLLSLPYAFGIAPGRGDLVARIDAALARVQASGAGDGIYMAWLANLQPPASWSKDRWLSGAAIGMGVLALGTGVAFMWRRRHRGAATDDDVLMGDLRHAIASGELGFHLQPKLDLRSGRVTGAELLVRWQHPRRGLLAPVEFIPLAERTGVLGELSLYMVTRAAELHRQWQAQGLELELSVNVSISDLADARIVDGIVAAVDGMPNSLCLEVTEDTAMGSPELVLESVRRLRTHHVGISLDDFGTGHSTLTWLRRLGPEELKIDRSFITGLLQSPSDQSIVRSSIDLAHRLGARFTAEGIEDADTLEWLAVEGCDEAQGYLIARPMPPSDIPAFCARQDAGAAARAGPHGIAPGAVRH